MDDSLKILLVEDDEDDRYLAERALRKAGLKVAFHAANGRVAVDYLSGEGKFEDRSIYPLPDVVFLDLKIPEITGHQVLEWINTQEHLKACRAYILSSSGEVRDRERAEAARVRLFRQTADGRKHCPTAPRPPRDLSISS